MPSGYVELSSELVAQIEAKKRNLQQREQALVNRDADKLLKKLLKLITKVAKEGGEYCFHGLRPRHTLTGTRDYMHVPPVVKRLAELGFAARPCALTGDSVLPVIIEHTSAEWRSQFRQCLWIHIA